MAELPSLDQGGSRLVAPLLAVVSDARCAPTPSREPALPQEFIPSSGVEEGNTPPEVARASRAASHCAVEKQSREEDEE